MQANALLWIPLAAACLLPLTFLITYAWSVGLGHVEPDFPYISATGTYPPESCFFGLMLNIVSALMAITVWVRHKQILDYCSQTVASKHLPKKSKISTYFGYCGAAGICLVGNFQATNVASVHLIGAFLAFGVGNIYLWIQSSMSLKLVPRVNSKAVAVVRMTASGVATLMNITTVTFSILHGSLTDDVAYWTRGTEWREVGSRQSWTFHLLATTSEWVLAAAFVVFLFTVVPEFKRIKYQGVLLEHERERSQARDNTSNQVQSIETIDDIRL